MNLSIGCPCDQQFLSCTIEYTERPKGETAFPIDGKYERAYNQCKTCGHFYSSHSLCISDIYSGVYSDATYGEERDRIFKKIVSLEPSKSDNYARCERINEFWLSRGLNTENKRLLDIGSGLGVFPAVIQKSGWHVTALDPDIKAIELIKKQVGCETIHADFMMHEFGSKDIFELITLNKVLEHVEMPIDILARCKSLMRRDGIVYIEVPDGENALSEGVDREEFYIEHHHVFSAASLGLMIRSAGFRLLEMRSLRENSGKYTVYAFCSKQV